MPDARPRSSRAPRCRRAAMILQSTAHFEGCGLVSASKEPQLCLAGAVLPAPFSAGAGGELHLPCSRMNVSSL